MSAAKAKVSPFLLRAIEAVIELAVFSTIFFLPAYIPYWTTHTEAFRRIVWSEWHLPCVLVLVACLLLSAQTLLRRLPLGHRLAFFALASALGLNCIYFRELGTLERHAIVPTSTHTIQEQFERSIAQKERWVWSSYAPLLYLGLHFPGKTVVLPNPKISAFEPWLAYAVGKIRELRVEEYPLQLPPSVEADLLRSPHMSFSDPVVFATFNILTSKTANEGPQLRLYQGNGENGRGALWLLPDSKARTP